MRRITVKAYAKINLALDVLGKRNDGYHQVQMIMQGISLYDEVRLALSAIPGIRLECSSQELGPSQENLAYRAAQLLLDSQDLRQGIHIQLIKNIPVAAGLAGGSADGAAVLLGLNTLLGLDLGLEYLRELAAKLGSDVPFCLQPSTALAEGRGELLTELPGPPELWLVLCKPPYGVPTAQVYKHLQHVRIEKRPDIPGLVTAIKEKDLPKLYAKMANVLEDATFSLCPELPGEAQRLLELGAVRVLMTGSGPTLMAFAAGEKEACRLAEKWPRPDWTVTVTRTIRQADLKGRVEIYE